MAIDKPSKKFKLSTKVVTPIRKVFESIADDIAEEFNAGVREFALGLREELQAATPIDTGHAENNWIIRKAARPTEYGERPHWRSRPLQPELDEDEIGITKVKEYDVRIHRNKLSIVNYVPYLWAFNQGTHPSQVNYERYLDRIGFVEKAATIAEHKYGLRYFR